MGRKPSIDAARGVQLIQAYIQLGSQRQAAQAVGVSQSAANRFLRSLPKALAPLVVEQQQILAAAEALLIEAHQVMQRNVARLEPDVQQLARAVADQEYGAEEAHASVLYEQRHHVERATHVAHWLVDIELLKDQLTERAARPPK